MLKHQDLTGQKFGLLTVIKLDHTVQKFNEKRQKNGILYFYKCICECGQEKIVNGYYLMSNKVKSCGCLKHKGTNFSHRLGRPDTYSHWSNIKTRCFNKNNKKYKSYGGRGITVCKEWLDFKNFHYWAINNGYKKGLSIERIDVNGNYEPDNCKWIPMEQQSKNRRCVINYSLNGKKMNINEWTKFLGCGKETIRERIKRGWTIEKALTTPIKKKGGN